MSAVSSLQTERLLLRGHRVEDFDAYAAMWSNPESTRHIGDGTPKSREEAWTSFLRAAGHWQMLGHGAWIVEAKGAFLGHVGFSKSLRDRGPTIPELPEVGWMFTADAAGHGYATEAVRAALDWGRKHFGAIRIMAIVAPENAASIRVAEKCGFREFLRGESIGRPRIFFDRVL